MTAPPTPPPPGNPAPPTGRAISSDDADLRARIARVLARKTLTVNDPGPAEHTPPVKTEGAGFDTWLRGEVAARRGDADAR